METYNGLMPMGLGVLAHMLVVHQALALTASLTTPAGGRDQGSLWASWGSGSASGSDGTGIAPGTGAAHKQLLSAVGGAGRAAAVAAASAQPHEVARIRRELDCQARDADESRQRVLNEVTYLLQVRALVWQCHGC